MSVKKCSHPFRTRFRIQLSSLFMSGILSPWSIVYFETFLLHDFPLILFITLPRHLHKTLRQRRTRIRCETHGGSSERNFNSYCKLWVIWQASDLIPSDSPDGMPEAPLTLTEELQTVFFLIQKTIFLPQNRILLACNLSFRANKDPRAATMHQRGACFNGVEGRQGKTERNLFTTRTKKCSCRVSFVVVVLCFHLSCIWLSCSKSTSFSNPKNTKHIN